MLYTRIRYSTMTRIELHSSGMGSRKSHMTTRMASFSGFSAGAGRGEIRVARHFPSEMGEFKVEGERLRRVRRLSRLEVGKYRLGKVFYRGIERLDCMGWRGVGL